MSSIKHRGYLNLYCPNRENALQPVLQAYTMLIDNPQPFIPEYIKNI